MRTALAALLALCASLTSAACAAPVPVGLAPARGAADTPQNAPPPREMRSAALAHEAFADLVTLDYAFSGCARNTSLYPPEGWLIAMRNCLRTSVLPTDCGAYRDSRAKAAELVGTRPGLAALVPAAIDAITTCRAPESRGAAPRREVAIMTPIDFLLGRAVANDGSYVGHTVSVAPAPGFLSSLCYRVFNLSLKDLRTSELLLCSDQGLPESQIDDMRRAIPQLVRPGAVPR